MKSPCSERVVARRGRERGGRQRVRRERLRSRRPRVSRRSRRWFLGRVRI